MSFDFTLSIPLGTLLFLMLAHWVGDFVLQSDAIAKGKSKSLDVLFTHVLIYTGVMFWSACIVMPIQTAGRWVVVNAVLHFVTDFLTSKASARLFAKGDVHNGFVVIGFDQFLHLVCLTLTWALIAA